LNKGEDWGRSSLSPKKGTFQRGRGGFCGVWDKGGKSKNLKEKGPPTGGEKKEKKKPFEKERDDWGTGSEKGLERLPGDQKEILCR